MNGWQRLFVLISAIVIGLPAAIWVGNTPETNGSYYIAGCRDSGPYTADDAKNTLGRTQYEQAEYSIYNCQDELTKIATGAKEAERWNDWRKDFRNGAIGIACFLSALYALGWALGWVWRGFFPKKSSAKA